MILRAVVAFGGHVWPLSLVCVLACAASHHDGDEDAGADSGGPVDAASDVADVGPDSLCAPGEDCRVVQIVTSSAGNTCALLGSGAVACWGNNERGQLGTAEPAWSARPVRVALPRASRLLPPTSYSCAITEAGILCWGGALDEPQLVDTVQIEPSAQLFGRFDEPVDGAVGSRHVCALASSGAVQCFGQNGRGELGIGTRDEFATRLGPFEVEGLPPVAVLDASSHHTCALGRDAALYCWGANDLGQVGDGRGEGFGHIEADALSPVRILEGIAQVSVGYQLSCVVDMEGVVWCWGSNNNGQVGYPTGEDLFSPSPGRVSLPFDERAVDISAGNSNTCAVAESGHVYCWGGNAEGGSLGVGDPSSFISNRPLEVLDIRTATAVSNGGRHACAIVDDGDLVCWGRNQYGSVGDGTTIDRPAPTPVIGIR